MKKNIIYSLITILLISCTARKPEKRGRFMKGFIAQYNTLFNAEQAIKEEINTRLTNHKDDFYEPYIAVFPYEKKPTQTDTETIEQELNPFGNIQNRKATINNKNKTNSRDLDIEQMPEIQGKTTLLEIAEAKAIKTINKYSVLRNEEEKNKIIFDAYITLIKARIYMGEYFKALDAINMMNKRFPQHKKIILSQIYQGLAYSHMGDYQRANKIFQNIQKEKINKEQNALFTIYYGENLIKTNEKKEAIKQLKKALEINTNKNTKSRIAYLIGQILITENQLIEAREYFQKAYKYTNSVEFEIKAQIEIAKTYNAKTEYTQTIKHLNNLSKKGNYSSRKNELLHAMGIIAQKAGKKNEARDFFMAAIKEKTIDPHIKGLSYYEIGKGYLEEDDYIRAGIYYDSAVATMTHELTKNQVKNQATNIKKVSENYYLIKKNDSIIALTKMDKTAQKIFFNKHIEKIKEKEAAEERKRLQQERENDFQSGDFAISSVFGTNGNSFQNFTNNNGKFYFANESTIARGINDFKQLWGNRALADNWRFSKKSASIEEIRNQAIGQTTNANPRRFESEFYIEQIPTSATEIEQLKKTRDQATLALGTLFRDAFADIPLATKTLYGLVDNKPEEKVLLQALFQIFSMNFENNPKAAERAKNILINEYPYTAYAEYAKNPKNSNFVKSSENAENDYQKAYFMYEQGRLDQSQEVIEQAIKQYQKDALIPKFHLLNAYIAGKKHGKEIMILQLQQIVLNYEKTPEGEKAEQLLKNIKSELDKKNNTNKKQPQQNEQKQMQRATNTPPTKLLMETTPTNK